MSTEANTKLLEEAAEMLDYFEGTMTADIIQAQIEANDLDGLYETVRSARFEMLRQEYQPDYEEVTDEDIKTIVKDLRSLSSEDVF